MKPAIGVNGPVLKSVNDRDRPALLGFGSVTSPGLQLPHRFGELMAQAGTQKTAGGLLYPIVAPFRFLYINS